MFGRLHVLPIVIDFLALFPEIDIRLLLADRNVHLIDDHVDMAVRIGQLPDSTMVATRIGSMRMVTCASPALLAIHGIPQTPEDLRRMPWVTFEGPTPSPARHMLPVGSSTAAEIIATSRLSVSTAEAAVEAAMRNVGATRLLHYQVADAIKAGALRIILEPFEPEPPPIHLIHAARGQMPLKMRSFLDFAAPRLRQALARIRLHGLRTFRICNRKQPARSPIQYFEEDCPLGQRRPQRNVNSVVQGIEWRTRRDSNS